MIGQSLYGPTPTTDNVRTTLYLDHLTWLLSDCEKNFNQHKKHVSGTNLLPLNRCAEKSHSTVN